MTTPTPPADAPTPTPRTDAAFEQNTLGHEHGDLLDIAFADFARQLERELAGTLHSLDAMSKAHADKVEELAAWDRKCYHSTPPKAAPAAPPKS